MSDETDLRLVVAEREEVAAGIVSLTLCDVSDRELPPWSPGAHIDLRLRPDLIRQYSLCGDPADRFYYRIGVLLEPKSRGGSQFVHESLLADSEVRGWGPRNNFHLVPSSRYLFIGGGIGITPLMSMILEAEAAGAEWKLVYGGRTRASMAFAADLQNLYPGKVCIHPQDESGMLDLESILVEPESEVSVYCCGPEGLLGAVEARCAGWSMGSLHVERFAPRPLGEPNRDREFEVELATSGRTLVIPAGKSILEIVQEAGVDVLSACGEGTCGTCETTVLQGLIEHRDSVLSHDGRAAQNSMMICVSRAACPRLVLRL
jgi:ferredoxin-NADP reductase